MPISLLLGVLGIAVFAGVIYLAVSKKSCLKVRIAALVALGLMILTIIVCIFIIFGVTIVEQGATIPPEVLPPETPPSAGQNHNVLLMLIVFLLAMFLLVLVLSMREQRRHAKIAEARKNNNGHSETSGKP